MVETSFYTPGKGKCPNCGSFGNEHEDYIECPSCETRFNEYIVLSEGQNANTRNN